MAQTGSRWWKPGTVVAHPHLDQPGIEQAPAEFHCAAPLHRLERVLEQIDEDLVELVTVALMIRSGPRMTVTEALGSSPTTRSIQSATTTSPGTGAGSRASRAYDAMKRLSDSARVPITSRPRLRSASASGARAPAGAGW
jgi:hypothetical protein